MPISSMHLPSRGLRLSATTMRKAGLLVEPIRFNRILTAINNAFSNSGTAESKSIPRPPPKTTFPKEEGPALVRERKKTEAAQNAAAISKPLKASIYYDGEKYWSKLSTGSVGAGQPTPHGVESQKRVWSNQTAGHRQRAIPDSKRPSRRRHFPLYPQPQRNY